MGLRRIIAVIASLSVSMSSLAIPQSYAMQKCSSNSIIVGPAKTATLDSGFCGAELRWWLEEDSTLTISGNDVMTSNPWSSKGLLSSIRRISSLIRTSSQ